jgi:predicted HTH domain antitoxin
MIQFKLPDRIEEELRRSIGNLDAAAREAFIVDSYRAGRLSVGQIGEILGIGVLAAEEWLSARNVELDYSIADLEADSRTLSDLFRDNGQ